LHAQIAQINDQMDHEERTEPTGVELPARGSSSTMYHRFEDCIAHVSQSETLYPGEVICSGTVGGGCGLEHGRLLALGDTVELEIEKIGVLRNRIVKRG